MTHFRFLLTTGLAFMLTACVPAISETTASGLTTPIISTALVGTAESSFVTGLSPNYTPPPTPIPPTLTPIPPLPDGLSPTELKYRVLAQYPDLFYCDPDYYPISRDDELGLARQRFPELQANPGEFNAILAHNGLAGLSTFSDNQKLLIYREHKKLAAIPFDLTPSGYQFQLQVAKTEGEGKLVTGLIDGNGTITVREITPSIAACPICLAAGALIDTPAGLIPVQDLRAGMLVWTMNRAGVRVALPLIRVGKATTPATHRVVHLQLDDGREVWVSPGHPTADGRSLGQLQVGDSLDAGKIRSVELVPYAGSATYDLLPAGETGFYWANGILLASTFVDGHE